MQKNGTRLHILHISTEKELELFESGPIEKKKITSEACVHHLWFLIRITKKNNHLLNGICSKPKDRNAILNALINDQIDVIATDHAPHTQMKNNKVICLHHQVDHWFNMHF